MLFECESPRLSLHPTPTIYLIFFTIAVYYWNVICFLKQIVQYFCWFQNWYICSIYWFCRLQFL